jgi:hypothetical protein
MGISHYLPQPPLPQMPGAGARRMARTSTGRTVPVPYFHTVFTLPTLAGEIAFQNKATVYGILFRAAAETLTTIAPDPRHLGAQIGVTAVLHTWGQTLQHQPPFGGPEQVLAYLGRYTHRVAIANSRLVSLSDGKVRFAWKDYCQDSETSVMTLDAK